MSSRKTFIRLFPVFHIPALVVLLGLITGCGGNSTHTSVNTVAFESNRVLDGSDTLGSNGNIWVIKTDGSGAIPLTKLSGAGTDDAGLVWSADGRKIAFLSSRALDGSNAANGNNTLNLWVMNSDGSGAIPLTRYTTGTGQAISDLAWSPDGRKIAFDSNRALDGSDAANSNETRNIWVVNTDGTGIMPLTRFTVNAVNASLPSWSRMAAESPIRRAARSMAATPLLPSTSGW